MHCKEMPGYLLKTNIEAVNRETFGRSAPETGVGSCIVRATVFLAGAGCDQHNQCQESGGEENSIFHNGGYLIVKRLK